MRITRRLMIASTVSALLVQPVLAHSLKDVEDQVLKEEKYFQPMDSQAPDFALEDADSRPVTMTSLRGKVLVLNFIYTSCTDVCPLHSELIAQLQSMINQSVMKSRVAFVTITTDPKRDQGKVLRDYGSAHGLDPVNWMFLTSAPNRPDDTTRILAKAYGLEFTQTEEGEQMHGIVTHVIDQEGRLRARFHGLKFEPLHLVEFVNALTNHVQTPHEEPPPTMWQWFLSLFDRRA